MKVRRREGEHVMDGMLACAACGATYVIRAGIPRMAVDVEHVEERTAQAFGYEWTQYNELADRYQQQYLDWIRPVTAEFFRGKAVLEGGCGKGRHTALAAQFGAKDVVAIDLGVAVEAAFANTRDLPNAHIVQGDLKRPPVKRRFDYAFSVGVLHHLPEPEEGFRALASRLVHIVSPIRERVTSRMPHGLLDAISAVLTVPLFLATRLIYGPTKGRLPGVSLPYGPYLSYIAPFPYREQRSIVFDHLVAPVAYYIPRAEFAAWFERAGMDGVRIEQHNGNSWRGFAQVPARTGAAALRNAS
jgi:SAM-dependent methyltransferase